jgi:hypothetical protein
MKQEGCNVCSSFQAVGVHQTMVIVLQRRLCATGKGGCSCLLVIQGAKLCIL